MLRKSGERQLVFVLTITLLCLVIRLDLFEPSKIKSDNRCFSTLSFFFIIDCDKSVPYGS